MSNSNDESEQKSRFFSEQEDSFIIENYLILSFVKIAEILNRNMGSVRGRAEKLIRDGRITRKEPAWSKKDEDFLVKNYQTLTSGELAKVLNKHESAINNRLYVLRLNEVIVKREPKLKFTDEEIKIIKEKYPIGGTPECLKFLKNRTVSQIKSAAYRFGLRKLSPQEKIEPYKDDILAIYDDRRGSIYKIHNKYGFTQKEIKHFLINNGVKVKEVNFHKRMSYDTSYFKQIDTHEKAYWLGFIYADGNVHKNTLQIAITDYGHLDKFKIHIKAEQAVRSEDKGKYIAASRFSITRPEIVEDLKRLGVEERKSMTLSFPTEEMVPFEFINSFMLGYFDGDGSICTYKPKVGNRKWNFTIISTRDFCDKFNKILSKECDLFESVITKYKRIPDKDIWEIHICGVYKDKLERIYNFLYKNVDFGLKRKQDRFTDVIRNNPKEPYSSKYYGVSKSYSKFWKVQWKIDGSLFLKDRFECEIEAARYFDKLIKEKNMDLRYLNFPNE